MELSYLSFEGLDRLGFPPIISTGERVEIWIKPDVESGLVRVPLHELRAGGREEFAPVRSFHKHNGFQQGRHIFHHVHSLGVSVFCESRVEAARLRELDFFGVLRTVWGQPMKVVLRGPGRTRRLVPDFWYVRKDGTCVLENVRAPDRRDDTFWEQSNALDEVAQLVGWEYSVAGESDEEHGQVLELLNAFATLTPRADVVQAVKGAFRDSVQLTFRELAQRCAGRDLVALAHLYALMWRRVLLFDLSQGLHSETLLRMGVERT